MIGVLDASMALAWQFERSNAAEALIARQVLRELPSTEWMAPAIWFGELANGLLRGERAGLINASQTAFFLNRIQLTRIQTDLESPLMRQANVLTLARTHRLTAYDASYLELVLRIGGVLATFDQKLAAAARAAGVRVFGDAA